MSDAMRATAAGRSVCLTPGYAMAVGPFDPFAVAAQGESWAEIETWSHTVLGRSGPCEALISVRFAVFSRLSEKSLEEADALSESELRRKHRAPGGGLLRAQVSVRREGPKATQAFLVGPGGIDVFGSSVRVSVLAPAPMCAAGRAVFPVPVDGFGALEEVWVPVLGEDGASLRPSAVVHTYCAEGVPAPVPPSAVRYEVIGAEVTTVRLLAGNVTVSAPAAGPVSGIRRIETDRNAVVAWEVMP